MVRHPGGPHSVLQVINNIPTNFPEEKRNLRRAFLRKHSKASPPLWASTLMLAEKWGIPPWEVEEKTSQNWFERASAYYDVIGEMNKPKKKGAGTHAQGKTGLERMKVDGAQGGEVDPEAGGTLIWPD